jgi:glucosyl-dolichyl phosphate glucuronosyltransferase
MNVTVILCTYNRCESLVRALGSVAVSHMPKGVTWEVLVIDNNSDDQTSDVAAGFCARYPGRFRYAFESQPGKSYALNKGIAQARGEVLAFMDDDVKVDPMWLQRLTAPLFGGQWAGCGGRILPDWGCAFPPRWLPDRGRYALAPLTLFDLGLKAGRLAESPFGTNMAFTKAMFTIYGGFRTDLGPHPASEIRGEDSEFASRLLTAGERLWYEPSAIVYHPVPQNRLRKEFFLAYWYDKGRADIRTRGIPSDMQWVVVGIPLRLVRRLAVWTARWMLAFRPSRRLSNKLSVWCLAGQIMECYRRGTKTPRDDVIPYASS